MKSLLIITSLFFMACGNPHRGFTDLPNQNDSQSDDLNRVDSDTTTTDTTPVIDPVIDGLSENEISYVKPGEDLFAARMYMLNQAKTSVKIQQLIFRGDESGYRIAQKLIALKKRGLNISVIIDPLHNFSKNDQRLYLLMENEGINVHGFRSMFGSFLRKFRQYGDFGIFFSEENQRYHEKMMIVDGEVAESGMVLLGGANIGNEYFRATPGNPKMHWIDTDVLIKGPAVQGINKTFDENILIIEALEGGPDGTVFDNFINLLSRPEKILDDLRAGVFYNLQNMKAYTPSWVKGLAQIVISRPRVGEDKIHSKYLELINNAESEILIANAYFVPEDDFIAAVRAAADRGVKIKFITNSKETNDLPTTTVMSRLLYKRLMNGQPDVEIYEWGGDKILGNGEGTNHSKFMVVDNRYAIIGSYNLDPRSHWLNSESVALLDSVEISSQYRADIIEWLKPKYTNKISLEQADRFLDPQDFRGKLEKLIAQLSKNLL